MRRVSDCGHTSPTAKYFPLGENLKNEMALFSLLDRNLICLFFLGLYITTAQPAGYLVESIKNLSKILLSVDTQGLQWLDYMQMLNCVQQCCLSLSQAQPNQKCDGVRCTLQQLIESRLIIPSVMYSLHPYPMASSSLEQ